MVLEQTLKSIGKSNESIVCLIAISALQNHPDSKTYKELNKNKAEYNQLNIQNIQQY